MKKYLGEEFLNKIYKDLVNSEIVKHTGKGGNKNEDVHIYMERLERITKRGKEHDNLRILKQFYYDKYIIKPENIPESYFKQQEQIALDRGYGHVHYTNEIKQREIEQIISEQKASLDSWIDYFASTDTEMYPTWFKYYCFQGMVRLGYFDKKEDKYTKRTESTVKPFIEINREAIAMVYDELIKVLNKEHVDDTKLEELLKSGSFSKIYAYCIKKLDSINKDNTNSEEGIWKKYLQGSDPNILFNDIHGKGTGWCTAGGLETATKHLEGGDFYVYFTKDENDEYTCPRIAIRTDYGKIAEIRGIAENQNLESNMEKVVDKKLEEFPDKEEYKKKCKDMEMLTYIYTKWRNNNNVELSKEELKFLYEVDDKILGFGYFDDPRIQEIRKKRDVINDWNDIFKISDEFTGEIQYLEEVETVHNLIFPRKFNGNISLLNLVDANNLKLPEEMNGYIRINRLTSAKGLILPKVMNGTLILSGLKSTEGLSLPKIINGDLDLSGLKSIEGLSFPKIINGTLDLSGLTSAEGLVLPETIDGTLDLSGLKSTEGLSLPKTVGNLYLRNLTSTEGLVLPETIDGTLDLSGLTSAEGLKLPETMNGALDLSGLTSAKGLKLPKTVGYLSLKKLTSAEGLILPEKIDGFLDLRNLINVEDIIVPGELSCEFFCPLANNNINVLKHMCKKDKLDEEIRNTK